VESAGPAREGRDPRDSHGRPGDRAEIEPAPSPSRTGRGGPIFEPCRIRTIHFSGAAPVFCATGCVGQAGEPWSPVGQSFGILAEQGGSRVAPPNPAGARANGKCFAERNAKLMYDLFQRGGG